MSKQGWEKEFDYLFDGNSQMSDVDKIRVRAFISKNFISKKEVEEVIPAYNPLEEESPGESEMKWHRIKVAHGWNRCREEIKAKLKDFMEEKK